MRESTAIAEKMNAVRLLVVDADGGLGDGRLKPRFSRVDLIGAQLATAAGWGVVLLTVGDEEPSAGWCAAAGVTEIHTACLDRRAALEAVTAAHGIEPSAVAYLGADLYDAPAMALCGLAAAPRDGALTLRRKVDLVLDSPGGRGALRELVERLLVSQEREAEVLAAWFAAQGLGGPGPWLADETTGEPGTGPRSAFAKIGFRR
jgi:3-deoxy-D-manno-octulosonate 8-phosphate phosphatase (KDO 8-P phosphatase)